MNLGEALKIAMMKHGKRNVPFSEKVARCPGARSPEYLKPRCYKKKWVD